MTRKKNKPKKASESGNKRKTISPLETECKVDNTQQNKRQCGKQGQHDGQHDGHYTESDGVNTNSQSHSKSPRIFTFDQNSLPPDTNMSYQQASYGAQYMPSPSPPGYMTQMSTPPSNTTSNSNAMPPWAHMLLEEMKSLKRDISKLENVEKTVNIINTRFIDLDSKVTSIEKRVCEVEKSCTHISTEFDSKLKELTETKKEMTKMKNTCEKVETNMEKINKELQAVTDRMTDSESRSMRNNLIFYGIHEEQVENCENSVKTFIKDKLNLNADEMTFDRAHRLGNDRTAKKPRPIVVRFTFYKERETVRSKAYNENDALRRAGFGVGVQRPRNVREARKALYHVMKQAQERGQTAKFYGDKLYINGEQYVPRQ